MTPQDILKLRKTLGLTQKQFAGRIGAARESVARWETGANPPQGANLKRLRELTADRAKTKRDKEQKREIEKLQKTLNDAKTEIKRLDARARYYEKRYNQLLSDSMKSYIERDVQHVHKIYRRLAAKYHPDRNPHGSEFMKDLNELWQAVK